MDEFIALPYGGKGAGFPVSNLIVHILNSGRDYIIQGQQSCVLDHTKPHSLDVWLRHNHTDRKDTKQAVNAVVEALVATGRFKAGRFVCPDSGRRCKGIALVEQTD